VAKGQFYLVQEWIDGEPLRVAEHAVWTEEQVWQLLSDLLGAIAHVHSKNLIHRDIKPDNIIIRKSDQLPCLIDFGAVKELMSTVIGPAGLPKSSIVIGTAGYMSQEQAVGRPTFSSDLYSLGMTAVCLLTGKSPAAISTHSQTGRLLWQQYVPTLSPAFEKILSTAIHPYPQNRYRSALDMTAALASLARPSSGLLAVPPGSLAETAPSGSRANANAATVVGGEASQAISPKPTPAFPVKNVAITATAFTLGAILLLGVSPKLDFNVATSTGKDTTLTATDNSSTSEVISEAIPEEPTTALDFTNRASLLYGQGRLEQARDDVNSALAIAPDNLEALILKGDILVNQSRVDLPGAIAAYTQALNLDPNNTDLLQKRCIAHQNNNALELAHKDCTQFLALTNNNASIYDRRGDIRSAQQNYTGAIEDYTQAIEINENAGQPTDNQSIYFSRAKAYEQIGDTVKALEDFATLKSLQ
ncbi:MAG: tetratricopeptide repeat protein, partial [Cyanobacteria bacterium J06560_2]